jgi:3-phenylpropionate/trans-cinnamate dioxygenase ferredoxin reductase subunit
MTKQLRININGEAFAAPIGELLLDSALVNGIEVPHDCRSGQCGTCLVRVEAGRTIGGDTAEPGVVHACQARVLTDLDVSFREPLPVVEIDGEVAGLRLIGADVAEVVIRLAAPFAMRPGQYCKTTFKGYPARAFSPTIALDGTDEPQTLRLHIRRLPDGRVSSRIGSAIRVGHPVRLEGPFGTAHFLEQQPNRLVLFASGTGFAPIWAIADSALREWPGRPLLMVIGARALTSFYMGPALSRIAHYCPQVEIFALSREPQHQMDWVGQGRPDDLSHLIAPNDIVHAAGAPDMVDTIVRAGQAAGARVLADAFTPSATDGSSRWRLPSFAGQVGRKNLSGRQPSLVSRLYGARHSHAETL